MHVYPRQGYQPSFAHLLQVLLKYCNSTVENLATVNGRRNSYEHFSCISNHTQNYVMLKNVAFIQIT